MKKRVLWLILSCLIVLSLVLASCAPAAKPTAPTTPTVPTTPTTPTVPTTPTTPTPTPAPGPEKPKYGGTFVGVYPTALQGFDSYWQSPAASWSMHVTNSCLIWADWAKGPAGSGLHDYWFNVWYFDAVTGDIAESWEIPDPNTIIYHIRKGVHWHDKPPVNGREMTAEDVAFSLKLAWTTKTAYVCKNFPGWFESVTVLPDKWTVVVKGHDSEANRTAMVYPYVSTIDLVAPESIAKYGDLRDWRNSLGTGPFMLVDSIPGTSYTYKRHPNYYGKDPVHPENQLPYTDGMVWYSIAEPSTRLAALRTGKVDRVTQTSWEDARTLMKTNPELKWKKGLKQSNNDYIWARLDKPELPWAPQDDPSALKVRQALHMAIDFKAIKEDLLGGEAEILTFPIDSGHPAYIPLEKLPESTRELFSYNPKKAKELLAEAGYPNGFKTTVLTYDSPSAVDIVTVVKSYWADIGVDLNIEIKEYVAYSAVHLTKSFKEMILRQAGVGLSDLQVYTRPGHANNMAMVDDPYLNERRAKVWEFESLQNQDLQNKLLGEMEIRTLDQVYCFQIPQPYQYCFWQPWVKGYHGEFQVGRYRHENAPIWLWIDQDLKKQMTGR